MTEGPIDEGQETGRPGEISRRRMLKRTGAAAALAWATPVITSLRTPAFAQATPLCAVGPGCVHCDGGTICGDSGPFSTCICSPTQAGGCFCGTVIVCGSTADCTTDADCASLGSNYHCVDACGCARTVCIPECGTFDLRVAAAEGPRSDGS